jgi:hypothetical protein
MLDELRLVVKEIKVRWRAGHVKKDDVLHRRGEMGLSRGEGLKSLAAAGQGFLGRKRGESHGAEAHRAITQEVAAGRGEKITGKRLLGK